MKKLWKLLRAAVITAGLLMALALVLALIVWTKGLFVILAIFGVMMYGVYLYLEYRESTKAPKRGVR